MGKRKLYIADDVIDTEYADDTALLAECLEQIMKLTACSQKKVSNGD